MKLKNYYLGACEEAACLAGEIEQTYYAMVRQPDYSPEAFLGAISDQLRGITEAYESLLPYGGVRILGNDIICQLCGSEIADVIAQAGN